jgi:hypothetical protein
MQKKSTSKILIFEKQTFVVGASATVKLASEFSVGLGGWMRKT